MKKLLGIILLGLLFSGSAYAEELYLRCIPKVQDVREGYMVRKGATLFHRVLFVEFASEFDLTKSEEPIKSIKRFKDSLKFFELANEENPNEPDILNLLGFTSRKVGDYTMAEIYYEQGLELDPLHNGINEYLGELYVQTNRIDKAKERLEVLKNCNCEEFNELDAVIKKGSSKN